MDILTAIMDWINSIIDFPQLSFLAPVFAVAVLMLVIDLAYQFVFLFFGKFFK